MIVEVTADDIREGLRLCENSCPIARALRRQTGVPYRVGSRRIFTADNDCVAELPQTARDFVSSYDDFANNRDDFEPFSFELPI